MRSSAASPFALSRPTNTSRAPMPARRSAATRPIPEVAPVTTQTLPSIPGILYLSEAAGQLQGARPVSVATAERRRLHAGLRDVGGHGHEGLGACILLPVRPVRPHL